MIVNSVRNILAGFGATAVKGGTVSSGPVGPDSNHTITVEFNFPAGMAPIVVGYCKVRLSSVQGGNGLSGGGFSLVVTGSPASGSAIMIGTLNQGISTLPDLFEGAFLFPFVIDVPCARFAAVILCNTAITGATVDLEVWGAGMAGGQ